MGALETEPSPAQWAAWLTMSGWRHLSPPSDSEGRGDEGSILVEQGCPVLHHVLPLVALISLSAFIQG